jgi:hypothetical protein
MSRRSFLVAIGIVVFLAITVSTTLVLLLRYEPGHYRRAALPTGERRQRLSVDCLREFSELVSALSNDKDDWYTRFTDEQINSWFEEAFMRCGLGEKILPEGISEPRVVFEQDRMHLAFRYHSGLINPVISIAIRIWLPRGEPNVVALQLEGFRAGAMPFAAQWLLEQISETARQNGIEVTWYRHEGHPVALLRFQYDQARPTLQLKAIQFEPGRITIHGKPASRAALPYPALAFAPGRETSRFR